jgi:hypothetical protein
MRAACDPDELFDAALQDHDIGRFLNRAVIANLEIGAVFARPHHLASLR